MSSARGAQPHRDAPRTHGVIAGKTDRQFNNSGLATEGAEFGQADDAVFFAAAVGVDGVLSSQQILEEVCSHSRKFCYWCGGETMCVCVCVLLQSRWIGNVGA